MEKYSSFTFQVLCTGIKSKNLRIYPNDVINNMIINLAAKGTVPVYKDTDTPNRNLRNIIGSVTLISTDKKHITNLHDPNVARMWRNAIHKYAEIAKIPPSRYNKRKNKILVVNAEINNNFLCRHKLTPEIIYNDWTLVPFGNGLVRNQVIYSYDFYGFHLIKKEESAFLNNGTLIMENEPIKCIKKRMKKLMQDANTL